MPRHYVAMAGLHGCMAQYQAVHDSWQDAVADLVQVHEMGKRLASSLRAQCRRYGSGCVELNLRYHGNEYAEVTACDRDTPDEHDEF